MSVSGIIWNPTISTALPSTGTTQWSCNPYSSPPSRVLIQPRNYTACVSPFLYNLPIAYRMYIFSSSPDEMASVTCYRLDQWLSMYPGRLCRYPKCQRNPNLHDLCIQALLACAPISYQVFSCNSPPDEIISVTCHWLDQWSCKPCYLPLTIIPIQHRNRMIYVLMLPCTFLFRLLVGFLFAVYHQTKCNITCHRVH
jgi:hypothetical protein